jgi:hypothetical protein
MQLLTAQVALGPQKMEWLLGRTARCLRVHDSMDAAAILAEYGPCTVCSLGRDASNDGCYDLAQRGMDCGLGICGMSALMLNTQRSAD